MTRHPGRQFTRLHFAILRISMELHFEHRFGHRDQGLSRSRGGHLSSPARSITISLKTFAFCGAPTAGVMPVPALLPDDKNCQVDALLPELTHAQAVSREIVWNMLMSMCGLPMITAASSPRRIA